MQNFILCVLLAIIVRSPIRFLLCFCWTTTFCCSVEFSRRIAKVSLDEFPFAAFPPYIAAGAVLLTGQTISEFYAAILQVRLFRLGDVFTGILSHLKRKGSETEKQQKMKLL
ncbi:hypothetical protein niasHT_036230 [Heterodera trifolii]|uniref:Uncharacterized protein n=1 Tax=Heterodera trifolii TaxID=157864 RepID=A0ABD2IG60_9BILA